MSALTSSADVVVRAFARDDRDHVTALANAHVAAVIPGASISTAQLMNQLEREPGQFIVDPWVTERVTLVAQQRDRIVAAAHLQRYGDAAQVPPGMRDLGLLRWFLCWPPTSFWPDSAVAGRALLEASLAVLSRWRVREVLADGALPVPGIYGIPQQWPHLRSLLDDAGFDSAGRAEVILIALVDELPTRTTPAAGPLTARRTLGHVGTRIDAMRDGVAVGLIELDTSLDAGAQRSRHEGLADIGNLWVEPALLRQGVGTWLMTQARRWLELGGVTRLLAYGEANSEDDAEIAQLKFLQDNGFQVITTTVRDLTLKL